MLLIVAFLAFVSLGLPDGVLGVAWPSVRRSFGVPLSQLGLLLATAMAGYLVSGFASGALVARAGLGRVLVWSSALTVAASLTYAVAPAWPVMVAGGALAGLGAGAIDAGVNARAAMSFSPRVMSWLHASYGVGATAGPMIMSAAVMGSLGWRGGYGVIAALLAGMTACFALTTGLWTPPAVAPDPVSRAGRDPAAAEAGLWSTLRRPRVWAGIAMFFVYTGLEVAIGQWTYSLLTEVRGMSPATAGTWVSAYWGSLTAGRVAVGALAARQPAVRLLRLGLVGAPLGGLGLWASSGSASALLALVALGLSLAGIFPLLMSETPDRVGDEAAGHAVGFQVSAASLGVAALPAAVGALAAREGLEVLGPFVVVAAVALLALHEASRWAALRHGAPIAPPGAEER